MYFARQKSNTIKRSRMPSDISHDSVMYSSPADIIMNIIHCEGFILKSLMSIVLNINIGAVRASVAGLHGALKLVQRYRKISRN